MGGVFGSQVRHTEVTRIYESSTLLHLIGADQPQKVIHCARLKKTDDRRGIQIKQGQVFLIFEGCLELYHNGVKIQSIRARLQQNNDIGTARPSDTGLAQTKRGRYTVSASMLYDDNGIMQTDEILMYWKSATELVCRYSCQTGGEEVILKSIIADRISVQERTRYLVLPVGEIGAKATAASSLNALTNADLLELLAGIPFFSNIPKDQLTILTDLSTIRVYPSNCIIFREDDGMSTQMFVTLAGTLEVSSTRATEPLATLGAGSFFGEMALLINIPRAATVRATESCMLMSIEKDAFHELLDKSPDVRENVYKLLKERLWMKALMSGVLPYFSSIPLPRMIQLSQDMHINDQLHKNDLVMDQELEDSQFVFIVYGALEITSSELKRGGIHREHSVFLTPGCYCGSFTFQRLGIQKGKVYARSPAVILSCPFKNLLQIFHEFPQVAAEANIAWFGERCDLASVLRHKVLTERYQAFLEAEHSDENFAFCMAVENFRACTPDERNQLAQHMREHYIEPNSPKEVNLPAIIRDSIIDKLKNLAAEEILQSNFYDIAWDEIMRLMMKDSFPRFKKSPMFQSVLDTLDPHLNRKGSKLIEACHIFRESLHAMKHGQVESVAVLRLNRMLSVIRKSHSRHQAVVGSAIISDPTKVRVEG
uniref:Cyclic nucleotide-binding domain-containing protein n=1 Tax=Globisporangium ultimum (strain ATCC 200006 / CBS 805.95 / DAOM BR144) TaxID=431595 RepID=K3W516_GLOUD